MSVLQCILFSFEKAFFWKCHLCVISASFDSEKWDFFWLDSQCAHAVAVLLGGCIKKNLFVLGSYEFLVCWKAKLERHSFFKVQSGKITVCLCVISASFDSEKWDFFWLDSQCAHAVAVLLGGCIKKNLFVLGSYEFLVCWKAKLERHSFFKVQSGKITVCLCVISASFDSEKWDFFWLDSQCAHAVAVLLGGISWASENVSSWHDLNFLRSCSLSKY